MKVKNPFVAKHWTIGRAILLLWCLFATAFVLYTAWGALNNVIFRQGVQRGVQLGQNDAVTRVIQLSQNCNTVNLFAGEGENRVEVGLVNSECSMTQVRAARDAAVQAAAVETPVEAPVAPVVNEPIAREPEQDPAEMMQLME